MANHYEFSTTTSAMGENLSSASSFTSELTELSGPFSSFLDGEAVFSPSATPTDMVYPSPYRLRDVNEPLSPRKSEVPRISYPRSPKKSPRNSELTSRQSSPFGANQVQFNTCGAKASIKWISGYGGLGTMHVLPREIRQMIYGYAFGSDPDYPVTVKECCIPDTMDRYRSADRKHGILAAPGTHRFNILQVSKAMRMEASWVVYYTTPLILDMNHTIAPYLLDHTLYFGKNDKKKWNFWTTAAQFHKVHLRVPESTLKYGDPGIFTEYLLRTTIMLCTLWEDIPSQVGILRFVQVHLGSMFQEMLPFNMESQASDRYGELLDWIFMWHPTVEPDFEGIALQCAYNLQRMLSVAGSYQGKYQWTMTARSQLEENDEGGLKELRELEAGCEKNGIGFIHCK